MKIRVFIVTESYDLAIPTYEDEKISDEYIDECALKSVMENVGFTWKIID